MAKLQDINTNGEIAEHLRRNITTSAWKADNEKGK